MKKTIDFISLGCSKNLVDSEILMGLFEAHGYHCTHDSDDPQGEIVVVNTCGFIADAKEESIINSKGEMTLPNMNERLTAEISRPRRTDAPTSNYIVLLIDDNEEFLRFANSKLRDVYDFHVYNDIRKAAADLETMHADIIVCKQEMTGGITGSEFCNQLKMKATTQKMKFVLLTDGVLTPNDMKRMNITMAADDYLAKPFNIQEAIMRLNNLLGLGAVALDDNLIEGAETRMLENQNSSMTTATENINYDEYSEKTNALAKQSNEDEMKLVETTIRSRNTPVKQDTQLATTDDGSDNEEREDLMSEYSMVDTIDRQLLKNIEQYVLQNMSRGQISLEEMANAMGMGRVPFFHRVRSLTNKTPAELVRDMRLKHACILLKRTNINMSELASNIGFMTAENFINIFKEKFGMTPLEYRLQHRK